MTSRAPLIILFVAMLGCDAEKKEATGCDSDDDCAITPEPECVRHVCRAGSCVVESRSAAFIGPCVRAICTDAGLAVVADPTNKPADTQCTVYVCEGTTLITHELTGGECGEPADASSDSDAASD